MDKENTEVVEDTIVKEEVKVDESEVADLTNSRVGIRSARLKLKKIPHCTVMIF